MTTHMIRLTASDGAVFEFACEDSETLIDASARVDLLLPSSCRQGSCGVCALTCTDGEYAMGDYNRMALPQDAVDRRELLPCRTFPRSDLNLLAPYDSSQVRTRRIPERSAEILEMERIADNVVRLMVGLEPDGASGRAVDFEPGQFMQIATPDSDVLRAFSPVNTANWEGRLEFIIRLHPGGHFSHYLERQARTGAALWVRGPQGGFYLRQNGLRPRWFLAGGTGLAPILSMLRRMAEYQEPQKARLFFGVNRESELFALDELERLKTTLPGLEVDVRVWRPTPSWRGRTGTPVDGLRTELEGLAARPGAIMPDVYLCGPPAMVDAARSLALAAGAPAEQIFAERFVAG